MWYYLKGAWWCDLIGKHRMGLNHLNTTLLDMWCFHLSGLFYDGIGNEIGGEMALLEANKLNKAAAIAAAKAAREEESHHRDSDIPKPAEEVPSSQQVHETPVAETAAENATEHASKGKYLWFEAKEIFTALCKTSVYISGDTAVLP